MKNPRLLPYYPDDNMINAARTYAPELSRRQIERLYQSMFDVAPRVDRYDHTMPQHERDLLTFIEEYSNEKKRPPSYKEMADAVGVTKGAINWTIKKLFQEKKVFFVPGKMRTVKVLLKDY